MYKSFCRHFLLINVFFRQVVMDCILPHTTSRTYAFSPLQYSFLYYLCGLFKRVSIVVCNVIQLTWLTGIKINYQLFVVLNFSFFNIFSTVIFGMGNLLIKVVATVQGQVGWDSELPDLVGGKASHGRGRVGTGWSLRSCPTETILLLCGYKFSCILLFRL